MARFQDPLLGTLDHDPSRHVQSSGWCFMFFHRCRTKPIQWTLSIVFVLFLLLFLLSCKLWQTDNGLFSLCSTNEVSTTLPLILISVDGFRYDYLYRKEQRNNDTSSYLAPTLIKLAETGVHATSLKPVFPTKTFPNHWTLVTGLYPENHGIIGNTMYNESTKEWFHMSSHERKWWNGEPIWMTAQKNHVASAVCFWPGSEAISPKVFVPYNASLPYEERIAKVINWLNCSCPIHEEHCDKSNSCFQFVAVYFEGVDHAGHQYGPDSIQVDEEIKRVDMTISHLLETLEALDISSNIIIVSDHGMVPVMENQTLDLDSVLSKEEQVIDLSISPVGMFYSTNETFLYQSFHRPFQSMDHFHVYYKQELPERWHIKHSSRVPPIITVADLFWGFSYSYRSNNLTRRWSFNHYHWKETVSLSIRGEHGYDNDELLMHGIFIASGPSFYSGKNISTISAVDVYAIACATLCIDANKAHNGSLARIEQIVGNGTCRD